MPLIVFLVFVLVSSLIFSVQVFAQETRNEIPTHVTFEKMTVTRCAELGVCDWVLDCVVDGSDLNDGNPNDEWEGKWMRLVNDHEGNPGREIPINRTVQTTKFPVKMRCAAYEEDGSDWESIQAKTITVAGGARVLELTNPSEGTVVLKYNVVLSEPQVLDDPEGMVPLNMWYSSSRSDFFATTQANWREGASGPNMHDYKWVGYEGHVFDPALPQPRGTIPLYHWWSSERGDNFLTTQSYWSGSVGDRKDGYHLFRIEGYVYKNSPKSPRAGLLEFLPLNLWWNPGVQDNSASAAQWRDFSPERGDKRVWPRGEVSNGNNSYYFSRVLGWVVCQHDSLCLD